MTDLPAVSPLSEGVSRGRHGASSDASSSFCGRALTETGWPVLPVLVQLSSAWARSVKP